MEIKNKFEKFLLGLTSILLLAVAVLGIKLESDNRKIKQFLENSAELNDTNSTISQTREQILSQAVQASAQTVTQDVATKTVIPGKIIKQTVPGTTVTKSDTTSGSTKH